MALNIGYLTSNRTASGDEVYTPFYAVEPLLEFIPKDKTIWCPFDEEWSAFYQLFAENEYRVIRSSITEGQDFLHTNLKNIGIYLLAIHHLAKKTKC